MPIRFLFPFLISLLLTVPSVRSDEIEARVKFVSKSAIYLNAGRLDGITVGARGEIIRGDQSIASLEVMFIADHSASCRILTSQADPVVGDKVIFTVDRVETEVVTDSVQVEPEIEKVHTVPELVSRTRRARINHLSGRIGIQYYMQDDLEEYNYDFQQPSLVTRLKIENLQGSHLDLMLRMRNRKTLRDRKSGDNKSTAWSNRIYEVSLTCENPDNVINYSLGRIQNRYMSGIGYLDGASIEYMIGKAYRLGFFGGTEPDRETSDLSADKTKFGIFANFRPELASLGQFSSTLALAGIYYGGQIDREFVYAQNTFSFGNKWSVYQSAEFNVNRGWRKDSTGTTFEISNFLVSLRCDPVRPVSFTLGYDNRKNVRTYENRTIADSLFDDALRQGYRMGATFRLPFNVRLSLNGGIRTRASGDAMARSGSVGVNFLENWISRVSLNMRVNFYSNLYSDGYQASLSLSRSLFNALTFGVEYGESSYNLMNIEPRVNNTWIKFDADLWISRRVSTSAYYEMYRGDGYDANRMLIEAGFRL